ncbi:AAA family ATPase [Methylocystis rosea]|uniref:AAA family ATPase n=1 Tax=Methylocystis rosea TaxID=173366 RepID=UPI000364E0BB|nr:AAA family ATPase [Methylocystis rosea]
MNDFAPITDERHYAPAPNDRRGSGRSRPERFKLTHFDDVTPDLSADYRIKGVLPETGLVVVWGPPKCGKSFFVHDMTMHVARGCEYRGRKVKQGGVVYCVLEGQRGFRRRLEAYRREKMNGERSAPFHLMEAPLNLVADHVHLAAAIREQVAEEPPVVIVLDTLNRSLVGSENDDKDLGAYVRAADAIGREFKCLVIIVHHCGHGGDRPRGHSLLGGALDLQISVKRDAANNVIAEIDAAKDMDSGLVITSRLKQVQIGIDDEGDAVTSCLIEPVDNAEIANRPSTRGDKGSLHKAFIEAYERLADSAKPTPGFDGKPVRKVDADDLREDLRDRGFLEVDDDGNITDTGRRNLFRAKKSLLDAKRFAETGRKIWRIAP